MLEQRELIVGVSTGLITSGVIFISRYSIGALLSWLIRKSGKARLAGEWHTTFQKDQSELHETAHVKEVAGFVWGEIRYSRPSDKDRIYKFRGTYSDGIVVATYADSGNAIDKGAFTLQAEKSAGEIKTLSGVYAWTDDDKNKPEANTYIWKKKAS